MFVQLFRFPSGLEMSDAFIIAGLFKKPSIRGLVEHKPPHTHIEQQANADGDG
jgi:hypothetical protein